MDELKIEANEESFVIVLQHGGNEDLYGTYTRSDVVTEDGITANLNQVSGRLCY